MADLGNPIGLGNASGVERLYDLNRFDHFGDSRVQRRLRFIIKFGSRYSMNSGLQALQAAGCFGEMGRRFLLAVRIEQGPVMGARFHSYMRFPELGKHMQRREDRLRAFYRLTRCVALAFNWANRCGPSDLG